MTARHESKAVDVSFIRVGLDSAGKRFVLQIVDDLVDIVRNVFSVC